MRLREYLEKLEEWEKKYGKPKPLKSVDLRKVGTKCVKCKKARKRMNRHHKGNDLMWAYLYPDEFASRYIEFHPDDIALLCRSCHKKIHLFYDEILYNFYLDWAIERSSMDVNYKPSIEECREYQTLCTKRFEKWMAEA